MKYHTEYQHHVSKPGYTLCLKNIVKLFVEFLKRETYKGFLYEVVAEMFCEESYAKKPSTILKYFLKSPETDVVLEILRQIPECVARVNFTKEFLEEFYRMVLSCKTTDRKFPQVSIFWDFPSDYVNPLNVDFHS